MPEMGPQPVPKTLCLSNIPYTMDSVQHNMHIMNQTLLQTFRELLFSIFHESNGSCKGLLHVNVGTVINHTDFYCR